MSHPRFRSSEDSMDMRDLSRKSDSTMDHSGHESKLRHRRDNSMESVSSYQSGQDSTLRHHRKNSMGSASSRRSSNVASIWTKMAKDSSFWDDALDPDFEKSKHSWRNYWKSIKFLIKRDFTVIHRHPYILYTALIVLGVFLGGGIALVLYFSNKQVSQQQNDALELGKDTGRWFSTQLDLAILPLFSMAQFLQELPLFKKLPESVGSPGGQPESLPYRPSQVITHRNITGVCDDPSLVERFNEIAATIKRNARMEGVLVNIQAVPAGVVCLAYPLNNTEDFEPPLFLDNTGALGHDLAKDPERTFLVHKTLQSEGVVIAGPLPLRQCQECHPTVSRAFIARLAIPMPGYNIIVDDVVYQDMWGFSVVLINWAALVEQSGIYESFDDGEHTFQLTRADQKYDAEQEEYYEEVVVLAESPNFTTKGYRVAKTQLQTTNNEWEITVTYQLNQGWETYALLAVVVSSILISFLLTIVLVEKSIHHDLLTQFIPDKALKSYQRGNVVIQKFDTVTIFFCDIVGYTSMSAKMGPLSIMRMVNEFFRGMDELARKHNVFKIETIGDSYLVGGGLPEKNRLGEESAAAIVALFALDAVKFAQTFKVDDSKLAIRCGINSGPAVAGIVGFLRPKYTIFGDTINTASRMESTSMNNKIQCSDTSYDLLQRAPDHCFDMTPRGSIKVKGKGMMNTFWLSGVAPRMESMPFEMLEGKTANSLSDTDGILRARDDDLECELPTSSSFRSDEDDNEVQLNDTQIPDETIDA